MSIRLSSSIELFDAMQFGRPRTGAVYYVHAKKHALIETGTSSAYPHPAKELNRNRIELDYIFVTHVHLDHAGGAGCLARDHPRAKIIVHQRGARHLIDPTRLITSVREATGELFSYYGEAIPLLEEEIYIARDGERFDLDQTFESIELLKAYEPSSLFYTHFGCVKEPVERLHEYAEIVTAWVERIDNLFHCARSPEEVITAILSDPTVVSEDDDPLWKLEAAMAVRGVLHYLSRKVP